MKLNKTITVDLEKCRKRVGQKDLYNDEEKAFLLKVFDLFERGSFDEAITCMKSVTPGWHEYIDEEVYDVLKGVNWGETYSIVKE